MKITATTRNSNHALGVFLPAFLSITMLFAGCGLNNEKHAKQKEAKPVIAQINAKYFSLASEGFQKVTLQCKSNIVNSAVSNIKDDILRNQMNQSETFVHWNESEGFGIEITDVPELPIPEQDKRLKIFMTAAKDRMLGVFIVLSPIFYGVIPADERKLVDFLKTDSDIVLSYKGQGHNTIDKYYFDEDLNLYKGEQFQNSKLVATLNYSFVDKGEKKYLSKLVLTDHARNTQNELDVDYEVFDGANFPSHIVASVPKDGRIMKDEITVLNVRSSRY